MSQNYHKIPNLPAFVLANTHYQAYDIPATPIVKGYDFNNPFNQEEFMKSFMTTGFQATSLGQAIDEINKMRNWRLSDEPIAEDETDEFKDPEVRKNTKCTIFLGYTSNMTSSGVRETIRFLVQHKMVDVLVTTAGGIEEDFIKCLGDTYLGDFHLKGDALRPKGLNRIGNLVIPNNNYCVFEDWMMPILDQMLIEQKAGLEAPWTPSSLIDRLGKEINNENSIYYWCHKNKIPVFSPAITDGSIGDMIFFHSYKNPGLVLDIAGDIRKMNCQAIYAKKSGMILIGGGVSKHHICNANLYRNGADFAVYINTAQEFDGSDGGARPDEAISWGKIKLEATPVKIYCDATIVFPLLVSQTFAKDFHKQQTNNNNSVVAGKENGEVSANKKQNGAVSNKQDFAVEAQVLHDDEGYDIFSFI
eukprot:TRINITY_DN2110_c1_g1_i2.p1 TRINITY_DN2110_c1_g1~~TRINITY_DN2110_c1_g1_i2.p1  ORF type:complete len:418 (+),score=106.78 TRINITY_DN2110_c1_g1_i2:102-1355(+)